MDSRAITSTDFSFPGQSGLYHGKVRDVYTINNSLMLSVATDRISAFDVVLPKPIPFKGQVLNQTAAYFLDKTKDIVPNWLQALPDPNVSAGVKADPVKVEMVIRGVLVGHAWREYSAGSRELCGVPLPEGLKEFDAFSEPIITPTSKAETGHDEDLTESEIIAQKLSTPKEWDQLKDYTYKLFARGQQMARDHGLVLADTKYEFGVVGGKLILIDEVHTPDSSRYYYADSFDAFGAGNSNEQPKQLSKEFVREWLMTNGFDGKSDQSVPEMTEDFIKLVSDRYIELYEKVTGQKFVKDDSPDILKRIEANVTKYLKEQS
ncbi:MAG TPA: phosphoribosylaminoimidazolesuccinocarboxamide synthase [Candidatus Saccharimonadales bacterium]|nr:phosphoribosylaminoimidazolesuccinocarboxamide synthase [Candidatus Saccharimonadales bacterium]